jgi:hypothetical protein
MCRPFYAVLIPGIVLIVLCIVISCTPRPVIEEKPEPVSASALVKYFRDFSQESADSVWKGRKIKVSLAAGSYNVEGSQVQVFSGFPHAPPVLIFECAESLDGNKKSVEIVGKVRGMVRDGKNRGQGIDFRIEIERCSVSVK